MTPDQAVAVQEALRGRVSTVPPDGFAPRTAAGLDVAYLDDDRLAAAVSVVDIETGAEVERVVVHGHTDFPYLPGLFAFRELPSLHTALERLSTPPDVLVCDGQGLAHPRRFGLACHLGVVTGLVSVGVAKTSMFDHEEPAPERGSSSPLLDGGEEVGRALRTRDGVRPVYVSVGHRIDLDTACALVLRLAPRYRLPETTRRADQLCRSARAGELSSPRGRPA